ncbi:rab-like protein 3 [Bradysia coprophila]|uniref:rab-like protein 3 n=1 Tax=Bradysia coprophila TaxID=38358 RepID=UPI00187DC878|nr:rab-like protein 3 [Bradysia coprophila]
MSNIDKVRIIVVGDSGVGKTSLVHLIANNEALTSPGWTIGCAVEVKLHEYKEGTPSQSQYFIELWDIGGSISHMNTRGVFYNPVHGVILVYDLSNRKSHENLQRWIFEILNKEGKDVAKGGGGEMEFDPEQFLGSTQIPILVIGTKADMVDDNQKKKNSKKILSVAEQCGAEEICLNCHDPKSLAAGLSDSVKLSRFFDKVIEKKFYTRDTGGVLEKRKYTSPVTSPYLMTGYGYDERSDNK